MHTVIRYITGDRVSPCCRAPPSQREDPFPRRIRRGIDKGDLLWSEIEHSRVIQILHNPRYAGAFAYGRTRTAYNARLKSVQQKVQQVLIPEAHEGYISWDEFERNQVSLA